MIERQDEEGELYKMEEQSRGRRVDHDEREPGLNQYYHAVVVVCLRVTEGPEKERGSSPKQAYSCYDLFATADKLVTSGVISCR